MGLQLEPFTVEFENITWLDTEGDIDVFEIIPADERPVAIYGWDIHNVGGTADAGDAEEEFLRFRCIRGHTTPGTGGVAATPRGLAAPGATAGFGADTNNIGIATAGTVHNLMSPGWNVRVPFEKWFVEEAWQWVTQAESSWVLRLMAAVAADDLVVSGTLFCLEQKT